MSSEVTEKYTRRAWLGKLIPQAKELASAIKPNNGRGKISRRDSLALIALATFCPSCISINTFNQAKASYLDIAVNKDIQELKDFKQIHELNKKNQLPKNQTIGLLAQKIDNEWRQKYYQDLSDIYPEIQRHDGISKPVFQIDLDKLDAALARARHRTIQLDPEYIVQNVYPPLNKRDEYYKSFNNGFVVLIGDRHASSLMDKKGLAIRQANYELLDSLIRTLNPGKVYVEGDTLLPKSSVLRYRRMGTAARQRVLLNPSALAQVEHQGAVPSRFLPFDSPVSVMKQNLTLMFLSLIKGDEYSAAYHSSVIASTLYDTSSKVVDSDRLMLWNLLVSDFIKEYDLDKEEYFSVRCLKQLSFDSQEILIPIPYFDQEKLPKNTIFNNSAEDKLKKIAVTLEKQSHEILEQRNIDTVDRIKTRELGLLTVGQRHLQEYDENGDDLISMIELLEAKNIGVCVITADQPDELKKTLDRHYNDKVAA